MRILSEPKKRKNINEDYSQNLAVQKASGIQKTETKDDKEDFLKQFPEYWNFEKHFHYNSKFDTAFNKVTKDYGFNKVQESELMKDIIDKVIGQAAKYLGLSWELILDDEYMFGFYKTNGSPNHMEILVPYSFKFKNLREKVLEWFSKQKRGQKKAPKLKLVESDESIF